MKKNVFLLAAAQAMFMTCGSLLVATSALVGYRLTPDKTLATLPLGLQMLANMLTSIPASMLMQRIGRRAGFLLGSTLGMLGTGLSAYAILHDSFALFALGAFLGGIFASFANYYRFAAADTATEDYRSTAISYVLAGGVIAAFIGPNLARWSGDWLAAPFAGSYLALSAILVLSFITLLFLDIPRPAFDLHHGGRPLAQIVRQPVFIVAVIGGMFGYGTMTLVMSATPLAMHAHSHAFSDTAFVIEWHVLGMFAPSFFTGRLIHRFGALQIMLLGALLDGACVLVNLTGTSVAHFWLALFLLGVGWNFLFIGATTLLTETYTPREKAKTQALNDFLVFSSVAFAALSAGALHERLGWRAVNLGVTPLIAAILITIVWVVRARRSAATTPDG